MHDIVRFWFNRGVDGMLRELRRLVDSYDERMLVGEVYPMDPVKVAAYYGLGDELHLAFNSSFMHAPWDAAAFRTRVARFAALVPEQGWPDHVLSRHDARRHAGSPGSNADPTDVPGWRTHPYAVAARGGGRIHQRLAMAAFRYRRGDAQRVSPDGGPNVAAASLPGCHRVAAAEPCSAPQ